MSRGPTTHPLPLFVSPSQCVCWTCSQMETWWWLTPTLTSRPAVSFLNWSSGRGSNVSNPPEKIPLFFFFTYLLKCNVLYQDIARMFTLRHQLRILTHQFMLQMVEHAIFWGAVWCIWNILIINHLSVCICSPPEPVISLVHRDYWQCFEQLTHQDACGR